MRKSLLQQPQPGESVPWFSGPVARCSEVRLQIRRDPDVAATGPGLLVAHPPPAS